MLRKDGSYVKIQRQKLIQKQIQSCFPKEVDVEKMILWTKLNIGLTREKAEEYINDVVEGNGWIVVEGKIKNEL
jgi:hypothetical protein